MKVLDRRASSPKLMSLTVKVVDAPGGPTIRKAVSSRKGPSAFRSTA